MSFKIIIFTTILFTILFCEITGFFSLHYLFESLLIGFFVSLAIQIYNNEKIYKQHNMLQEATISNYRQLCDDKTNLIKLLEYELEINAVGQKYYFTENGSKLHSTIDCDSLYGKNTKGIIIGFSLKKIFDNDDKFCKNCGTNAPYKYGITTFTTNYSKRLYENIDSFTSTRKQDIITNQISLSEYKFLLEKFPEILIN